MKIGICSDHAGYEYKARLIKYLKGKGYEVVNFGTDGPESMDYADVAHPMASEIEKGNLDCGIALCGSAFSYRKRNGCRKTALIPPVSMGHMKPFSKNLPPYRQRFFSSHFATPSSSLEPMTAVAIFFSSSSAFCTA